MRNLIGLSALVVLYSRLPIVVDAACATVAGNGKCATCTAGTFGGACTRNFANKGAYSLLLPELIILSLLILLFVVMWAVFLWYFVWGWDKTPEEEATAMQHSKTSPVLADEPVPEIVTENSAQRQQQSPQSHPQSQQAQPSSRPVEPTPLAAEEGSSPQSLRVSDGTSSNQQATPQGGVQRAPDPQMMDRTPHRSTYRDEPVQSANTPISPSPIQPRSRQQDVFTPPRRDDSPPRRAPSHVYNPQQQQYRSIDPSTRHGDSNPFASELQRNLSPTRPRASRALAAPPTETTPGSHCPYGSSAQGNTINNGEVDSPYRHAHHTHAHDDVARGGVRGPYSDTRVDAARRHEAYDPHRPPADTKVDLTQHTQGGSRNGPAGVGTQRGGNNNVNTSNGNVHQSPRDVNYRSQTASPNAPRSHQQQQQQHDVDSNSQQQQWDNNSNAGRNGGRSGQPNSQPTTNAAAAPVSRRRSSQGGSTQGEPSGSTAYPPSRGVGQSAAAPASTRSSQYQQNDSRQLFGGAAADQQGSLLPSGGSSVHNYPTSAHSAPPQNDTSRRSNNVSDQYPVNSRRSAGPRGGQSSHPTSSNPPSSLYSGGDSHVTTPAAAALSQWPAVSTQASAPNSATYAANQNSHQSQPSHINNITQQQGYASKKPAPLVEDDVYPNVPTDPTFMNGLSRRSRSRGPGGGRRKSVGEEDGYDDMPGEAGGYDQQHQYQQQQQQQQPAYQDPNQRFTNTNNMSRDAGLNNSANVSGRNVTRQYPAESTVQQQQQQPSTPYNPPVRAASVRFPTEPTSSSRNYSQNNNNTSRQNTSYNNNNNRSDSNMSTFGDNNRQRGRMSVFPAPPRMEGNSTRAESHYDLPSSRSPSHF